MARGIYIFIALVIMTAGGANAASVRGVSTASRGGVATAQNQNVNPAASYTYNYMYPYMNNAMRTTLKPNDATSQSTSPINAVVRTEQLATPRRVVPRKNVTVTTPTSTNTDVVRSAVNTTATNARRVVPRRNTISTSSNANLARATSRVENSVFATVDKNATKMVSSSRCLADYAECMNRYCEQENTAYNRCYCSAKLAQIDAEYEPQIDELAKQLIALQYGNNSINNAELNAYWAQVFGQYTGGNSWANLDDALNIDWASMESRVRGQNAFVTGHEYCVQHISGCFYMASNLRDAYRSTIAKDCATYEAGLNKLKTVAESVIEAYKE